MAKAEEPGKSDSSFQPAAVAAVSDPNAKIDDCKDLLPQIESDYHELELKYRNLNQSISSSQENYLVSFNQMTEILYQITLAREEEAQKMSVSRDQLKSSVQKFNQQRTDESAQRLQESYLDLTVRIYSSLMDSQKTLENLKSQLSQVETNRSQFFNSKQELEGLDHQKLAIEGKLISLKIKCQPDKRY
jgi:hypothetical protein